MSKQQPEKATPEQKDQNIEIDDLSIDEARQDKVKGGVGIIQKAGGGN